MSQIRENFWWIGPVLTIMAVVFSGGIMWSEQQQHGIQIKSMQCDLKDVEASVTRLEVKVEHLAKP